jgi:hypothetical protein
MQDVSFRCHARPPVITRDKGCCAGVILVIASTR